MDDYIKGLEEENEQLKQKLNVSRVIQWHQCPKNENRFDFALGTKNHEGCYTNYIATVVYLAGYNRWQATPKYGLTSIPRSFDTKEEAMEWIEQDIR
jgi:hypothetical protein